MLRFFPYLMTGGTSLETPQLISDGISATAVTLYWSDVDADTYTLYQDGVQVYSGAALSYAVIAGIAQGNVYDFYVVAEKAGFTDSQSATIEVDIPTFYNTTSFLNEASIAAQSARQTALEPTNAGVDKTISYSCWFRLGAQSIRNRTQYLFNVWSGAALQMACYVINSDNQTSACEKLRFGLYNGANYIEVQTTTRIKIRNWYHIAVTYDGTENVNGIKIYINGVLETPVPFTGGAYVGALNNAGNRFYFGNISTLTKEFVGNVRDLAVWNKVLVQAEVTELSASFDIPAVSFYASIIALWKFQTDATCHNNATYNFTASTLVYSQSLAIDPTEEQIFLQRAEIGSTRYVAFGGSYLDSDGKIKMYLRSGTSHVIGGRVEKITYDPADKSVVVTPVITDGSYSMSGVSLGKIGTVVHVFCTRYDQPSDTFIDSRIYRSTDGETGEVFDAGEVIVPNYIRFEFYGDLVSGNGMKAVPYFGHNGAGTWRLSVLKSTDDFATHTKITVSNGVGYYGEGWLAYSRGKWIMLLRRNQAPYGIFLSYSTDDCATWSVPVLTNLGSASGDSNCCIAVNSVGNLHIALMRRGTNFIYLSKNNDIDYVIANPTLFATPTTIGASYSTDSTDPLGYPNLVHLGDEEYFLCTSNELSVSRADMFMGHGKINRPV
jgi:hypothetical protein